VLFAVFCGYIRLPLAHGIATDVNSTTTVDEREQFILPNSLDQFKVDERLQKNVDFWVQIYSRYTSKQGLIHDAKYVDRIYEVLDFEGSRSNTQITRQAKKKWKAVLLSLHHRRENLNDLSPDEKKVVELFKDSTEPNKYLNAAHRKRLRFQLGQKDRFLAGLQESGRYLPAMEEIFKREGLPIELTRLPFVESSFNLRARSKVGASGIWQFMKSTARLFITINAAVDERNDPIRATEAAVKLLKLNYESLGNWGLAVTAYNHGRKGMMRAVRAIGTGELEELTSEYRSRSFGFASGNFFTELLAAVEVEKNAEKYFGKITRDPPIQFLEAKIPDFIRFPVLLRYLQLSPEVAKELNPGLNEEVYEGHLLLPKGYTFRFPKPAGVSSERGEAFFLDRYAGMPQSEKQRGQRTLKYDRKHHH
jgi:membrane-bound lytic murein transglycosylase D